MIPPAGALGGVSDSIIQTQEITKSFGDLVAVDHLTLEVSPGDIFGLLGQNGSGKTTLIRMLNTLLPITSGRGFVCGLDVEREAAAVRRVIGVVPQALTSDTDLTAMENMDIYARFYEVPAVQRRQRIRRLLEHVELWEFRNKLVGAYSGGMRRRLEIARGLVHRPRLMILDEPTIGLDPNSRRKVWTLLEELMDEMDLTVLMTTHYLDEAEHLCAMVAVIDKGRRMALGTPAELCKAVPAGQRILLRLDRMDKQTDAWLERVPGVDSIERVGADYELVVSEPTSVLTALVEGCRQRGTQVQNVSVRRVSLEDAFIHFVGHHLRDEVGEYKAGAGTEML